MTKNLEAKNETNPGQIHSSAQVCLRNMVKRPGQIWDKWKPKTPGLISEG
jgi:hypothetical protein